MKRISLIVISVILILSISACGTSYETDSENDLSVENSQSEIDTSKYIIQTPFYQIYEEDLQKYKYRITNGKDVLAEDTKTGTEPQIEDKGDGVLRLFLGFGTNAFSVKYFNVFSKTVSEEFNPNSIYADYVDTKEKEYYIAYFKPEEKPKLYINGFFDSAEFSNELDLNFSMATCDKLIFLNEEEIYIEYIDNDSKSIKKVVNFKN
ncbi:MAG: hypothetical protein IKC10_01355 [Alphaproteobacteria bacterium]|nr:hypothetical protein [Alphaproteobacteria bacterium]